MKDVFEKVNFDVKKHEKLSSMLRVINIDKDLSRFVRKPTFCICKNKDADMLRGYREADQRLCFRYTDSIIPLLSKSEISIL